MATEDELMTNGSQDVEPLLPDGWKEGDDIFAGVSDESSAKETDGSLLDELGVSASDSGEDDLTALTMSDEGTGNAGQSAGEAEEQTQPDGAETAPKPSRILKLKVNHQEREVDVASLGDDELTAMLQKSYAYDDRMTREKKAEYQRVRQDQIDAGMSPEVADLIAQSKVGKEYAEDESGVESDISATTGSNDSGSTKPTAKEEVHELFKLYPNLKQIPDEVSAAYSKGASLVSAYQAYMEQQAEKAAASLQRENRVLKQNAANAAKAPVRGVTGGGPVKSKGLSAFEQGFDSDPW